MSDRPEDRGKTQQTGPRAELDGSSTGLDGSSAEPDGTSARQDRDRLGRGRPGPELCRTGPVRAVVQAGTTATPYHRSGVGRPVLVLREPGDHPVWNSLLAAVGERFRMITPEIPPGMPEFERWLRQFLDGLGLIDVRILADERLAAPAVGFAILEADRVDRLVVIAATGPAIPGSIAEGGRPILFLRDDRPSADLVTAVIRFLAAGDPATEKAS